MSLLLVDQQVRVTNLTLLVIIPTTERLLGQLGKIKGNHVLIIKLEPQTLRILNEGIIVTAVR
jgi:hypothetical protein